MAYKPPSSMDDPKRLWTALVLCAVLLVAWQFFVEIPKRQKLAAYQMQQAQLKKQHAKALQENLVKQRAEEASPPKTREERLGASSRVAVKNPALKGSIALKGLRFDDMVLATYRETVEPGSPNVTLFSPSGDAHSYFAQAGWLADGNVRVPDDKSVWKADRTELSPGSPVTFSWDNGAGLRFLVMVSLDERNMFNLIQHVENKSQETVRVSPYLLINRTYTEPKMHAWISHEGPLGVAGGTLKELDYKEIRENATEQPLPGPVNWFGFTDKYWLTAWVPDAPAESNPAQFAYYKSREQDRYQADYRFPVTEIAPNDKATTSARLFVGAKEVDVLDAYTKGDAARNESPIPLFDRAVDFGILYFLTKPIFYLLDEFFTLTGNFGIAILLLTIVIKLLMYPMANKSYIATTQMRLFQPEMLKIKERYANDRIKMQQEMMALYKREGINPASGCLPVLVQIPVFFALYKVLFVTIEMRHAPFFGWIRDLSAGDSSNLFTLFGLVNWTPPSFLHLGILPILMCLTMAIQMRQQPKPNDPVQAKVMAWMPYILIFVFAPMPAGLLLYWTWSNILSILQQYVITRRYGKKAGKKGKGTVSGEGISGF